jgi:hypothetical protein
MSSTRKAPEHIIPAYSLLPEGADTEAAAAEAAQPAQAAEAAQSTQAAEAAPGRVEAAPEAARAAVAAAAAAVYGLDLCVFSRLGHRLPTIKPHGGTSAPWGRLRTNGALADPGFIGPHPDGRSQQYILPQ